MLKRMAAQSPKDILEMLLGHLGFVFEVREEETVLGHVLQVTTRDPARLIGRDGHTLDELQYLVNRLAHPEGTDELVELASYDVRTTTELEDLEHRQGRVYALRPTGKNT